MRPFDLLFLETEILKKSYPDLHWQQTGIVQLLDAARMEKSLQMGFPESFVTAMDVNQISELSGVVAKNGGLYFPKAGFVSPKQLCEILYMELKSVVNFIFNTSITKLKREKKWTLSLKTRWTK